LQYLNQTEAPRPTELEQAVSIFRAAHLAYNILTAIYNFLTDGTALAATATSITNATSTTTSKPVETPKPATTPTGDGPKNCPYCAVKNLNGIDITDLKHRSEFLGNTRNFEPTTIKNPDLLKSTNLDDIENPEQHLYKHTVPKPKHKFDLLNPEFNPNAPNHISSLKALKDLLKEILNTALTKGELPKHGPFVVRTILKDKLHTGGDILIGITGEGRENPDGSYEIKCDTAYANDKFEERFCSVCGKPFLYCEVEKKRQWPTT